MGSDRALDRILIIVSMLGAGGAERQLCRFMQGVGRERFEYKLVIVNPINHWLEDVRATGVSIEVFPEELSGRVARLMRLVRIVRSYRPSIVHSWMFSNNLYAALTSRLGRAEACIGNLRSDPLKARGRINRVLSRLSYTAVDHLIANSQAAANELASRSIRKGPVHVVRNGVHIPSLPESREFARDKLRSWGIENGFKVIGTVGRMDENKNHIMLLDVFCEVLKVHPMAKLLLIGDGVLMPMLKDEVSKRGIGASVVIPGIVRGANRLLAGMDVVCLTSRSEGLPNVLLEAGAVACPVVSTAAGGTEEIVEDGKTGFVVPCDDVAAMTSRVLQLLDSPELRREMGQAGLRKVSSEFSMDSMVRGLQRVYEICLREKGLIQ
ncbi:glycosyltransferase [bacterium]|nr:glycosyltransferase [bacterium]